MSEGKINHVPQYVTAAAATLGALSMGTILGYSSPASAQLKWFNTTECIGNSSIPQCDFNCTLLGDGGLSDSQLSWFSSSLNLGALVGAPMTGVLINKIGRKTTMYLSIFPFILGWVLIGQ